MEADDKIVQRVLAIAETQLAEYERAVWQFRQVIDLSPLSKEGLDFFIDTFRWKGTAGTTGLKNKINRRYLDGRNPVEHSTLLVIISYIEAVDFLSQVLLQSVAEYSLTEAGKFDRKAADFLRSLVERLQV